MIMRPTGREHRDKDKAPPEPQNERCYWGVEVDPKTGEQYLVEIEMISK